MQLCSVFTETRVHDNIIVIAAEEEERVMAKNSKQAKSPACTKIDL